MSLEYLNENKSDSIIENYVEYSYEDFHTGLVRTNLPVIGGNSGGPVFIISATTLSSGCPLVGIVSITDGTSMGFYSYISVVSSLGLTKY